MFGKRAFFHIFRPTLSLAYFYLTVTWMRNATRFLWCLCECCSCAKRHITLDTNTIKAKARKHVALIIYDCVDTWDNAVVSFSRPTLLHMIDVSLQIVWLNAPHIYHTITAHRRLHQRQKALYKRKLTLHKHYGAQQPLSFKALS